MVAKKTKATSSTETASAPEQRDFVQDAIDYAKAAVADKKGKRFGRWVRLAGARFLADLKRARYDHAKGRSTATRKNAPFVFDVWHAWDPCDFIEKLPHVEGECNTPTVVMHESHIFLVVNLFGFRNHDGTRRFTTALFAVARKNAKSFLCSAVLLYCFCCETENGPQVISAATTGSQARIVFNTAKRIAPNSRRPRSRVMSIQKIIEGVLERKKGYANNPKDAGGETMWGITIATARRNGYSGPMRELTRGQAASIYLQEYVVAPGFMRIAAINILIAEELVDSGVNCGTSRPGPWLAAHPEPAQSRSQDLPGSGR